MPPDRPGDMHLGQQAVKARVAPGPIEGGVVMVRPRVAIWALVAMVAGTVALAPLHGGVKTADAAAIAFETPTIVDPIHTNGEPDIAIDPQGRVFNSGPTGTGTQRSTWFGSVDGGHTFRVMAQKTVPSPIVGIPAPGPGQQPGLRPPVVCRLRPFTDDAEPVSIPCRRRTDPARLPRLEQPHRTRSEQRRAVEQEHRRHHLHERDW